MKLHCALSLFTLFAKVKRILGHDSDVCLGSCSTSAGGKECTFTVKLDLHAGELGYYYFDECDGVNPTLGKFIIA